MCATIETLETLLCSHLRRPLELEELEVIRRLTAAGIAKINHDHSKGISLLVTLEELKLALAKMKQRRALASSTLSTAAKRTLSRLKRSPTTEEIAMFAYMPMASLKKRIAECESKGERFDDIVEDLALQYKHLQLRCDGMALVKDTGLDLYFNNLTPTVIPQMLEVKSLSMARVTCGSVRVGFSPHTVWFHDNQASEDDVENLKIVVRSSTGTKKRARKSPELHCRFQVPTLISTPLMPAELPSSTTSVSSNSKDVLPTLVSETKTRTPTAGNQLSPLRKFSTESLSCPKSRCMSGVASTKDTPSLAFPHIKS